MSLLTFSGLVHGVQMALLMILGVTLSFKTVEAALIHGSVLAYGDQDSRFLSRPINVTVGFNDVYQLDVMMNGSIDYKVRLGHGDNCTLQSSNSNSDFHPMCPSLNILPGASPHHLSWPGCPSCLIALTYTIVVDAQFKKLFQDESELTVSFIQNLRGDNDPSLTATIRWTSEPPTSTPCDCPTCSTTDFTPGTDFTTVNSISSSMLNSSSNRGNIHLSTMLVVLSTIISVLLVSIL